MGSGAGKTLCRLAHNPFHNALGRVREGLAHTLVRPDASMLALSGFCLENLDEITTGIIENRYSGVAVNSGRLHCKFNT